VFSDGVPDARDPHGKRFEETRLLRLVAETPPERTAEQVAAEIQEHVTAFIATADQYDDVTLLVIRRTAS
jgi:serine phosphatase RsbU (regulator of sigma subunit)